MSNTNLSLTANSADTQLLFKGHRPMRSYSGKWMLLLLGSALCLPAGVAFPPLWLVPIGGFLWLFIISRFTYYEVHGDRLSIKQNILDRMEWVGCYSDLNDAWMQRTSLKEPSTWFNWLTGTTTIRINGKDNHGITRLRTENGALEITGDVDKMDALYLEIQERIRLAKKGRLP